MESHLSSAAAFVEGGIQDPCDDACSICLENFVDSDPSTVTSCRHEFHLQCILEWCQRSAQCPMCWQAISLKDATSQELLDAVECERNIRSNQTRYSGILHHPALADFDLQHLSMGANDAELEERIIQHLTTAAAMGRTHRLVRRSQRGRSSGLVPRQFLVSSPQSDASSTSSPPASSAEEVQVESAPLATADNSSAFPNANRISVGQDRAGPSDIQVFSESLKSRLNSVSTRYKESITKNTRGWKERLFSRNSSVSDIGSEVKKEVSAGIATVTRMIERLDTRESKRTAAASVEQTERVTHDTVHILPGATSSATSSN